MKKNAGMTMVEVMVAFAIFLIGIAFLYQSTSFSLNELRKAKEVQTGLDQVAKDYYESASVDTPTTTKATTTVTIGDDKSSWEVNVKSGSIEDNGYTIYFFGQGGQ